MEEQVISLTITFSDKSGSSRVLTEKIESAGWEGVTNQDRLAQIIFSELKATIGAGTERKHNATAWKWLEFPNRKVEIFHFLDLRNSNAMWFELANLVLGAENDLVLAQAFKGLEPVPPQSTDGDDDIAINALYHLHDRKMMYLNEAVRNTRRVENLVDRLLHESLGGDLVDTSTPRWEQFKLIRENVLAGLKAKRDAGVLSDAEYTEICAALGLPKCAAQSATVVKYRNRLMHHNQPSVDYPFFYSELESRQGTPFTDANGKQGVRWAIRSHPPVSYQFAELSAAVHAQLDAVVEMLQRLSMIEKLR